MKVAIIGAGIAGAVLAQKLKQHAGFETTVFDKSRGIGGRMSTRYTEQNEFDHGAQFFTARTHRFKAFISEHLATGAISQWDPKVVTLSQGEKPYNRPWFEPHFVSTPRMNSLCKHVLADHTIKLNTKIVRVSKRDNTQQLEDESGNTYGPFDWVVSTAPAEQTAELLPTSSHAMALVKFNPCFTLMLAWDGKLPNWQAAKVKKSSIAWLCLNQLKPGRESESSFAAPSLVAQSSGQWAEAHFEHSFEQVKQLMCSDLAKIVYAEENTDVVQRLIEASNLHRWRYAQVSNPLGQQYWQDTNLKQAACGDWCLGSTIEDAFVSASALANNFLQKI